MMVWKALEVLGGVEQLVVSPWYSDEMAGSRFGPRPNARVRQYSLCHWSFVGLVNRDVDSTFGYLMQTVFFREFI